MRRRHFYGLRRIGRRDFSPVGLFIRSGGKGRRRSFIGFLPEVQEAELVRILENKQKSGVFPEGELLCGILNNQLGRAVMRRCDPNPKSVAAGIKNFTLRVSGTLGFDYAQVTKGGIRLTETDATLQSRLVKGLYFAGEILDVDGECGGYNLQWAYTSARLVADALNERRKDREA